MKNWYRKLKHFFGVHSWLPFIFIADGVNGRECAVCGRCEMEMADKSWAHAMGVELERAELRRSGTGAMVGD